MPSAIPDPVISVIIPVLNEVRFIDRCLCSIFAAEPVAGGTEVLAVDGMSEDGTRQILADWSRRYPNLHVLNNPQRIVPTAMNIGIRAARGRWIIRLDAHSEYPRDYFTQCLETSRRTGRDNVGGSIIIPPGNGSRRARLFHAVTTHPFGVGNSRFRIGGNEGEADTVPYGCYRREVFERIGFYDERLVRNQDYELNRRLRKSGGSIWHDPAIRVFYYNERTFKAMARKAFANGQWNPWTWYVAPYSFAWRHAIPTGFVGTILAAFSVSFMQPVVGQLAIWFLLAPYFLLSLAAAYQQSRVYGLWVVPYLPFLFWGYHLFYGLGGLWGMWLLGIRRAPVQTSSEPWPGAGAYRAWPLKARR